ncbi:helix-turn-helix domain-containing protein [Bacillus sp. USDA818B3_A]|uniref:helix-turn-helix domain-containing protein n=1 Tax=Bacillus sp. USDA818B3_A TaxID=2698834 RepID=UPI003FA48FEB
MNYRLISLKPGVTGTKNNKNTIINNKNLLKTIRKMSVTELSERVGITMANLSILKNGKAKAIRFSTLEAICKALDCQPRDILEYKSDET